MLIRTHANLSQTAEAIVAERAEKGGASPPIKKDVRLIERGMGSEEGVPFAEKDDIFYPPDAESAHA
jgi:broad specificity phosphatase PhoE